MKWVPVFIFVYGFAWFSAQASDWKAIPESADERAPIAEPVPSEVGKEEEEDEEPKMPTGAKLVSGVVRFTRAMPETEIFIKDAKDSVFIPNNKQHNSIFEACEESRKNKTPVQLIVDIRSRHVLRLATEKEVETAKDPASSPSAASAAKQNPSTNSSPNSKSAAPSGPPGSK